MVKTREDDRIPPSKASYLDGGTRARTWLTERTDASTSHVTLDWGFPQLDKLGLKLRKCSDAARICYGTTLEEDVPPDTLSFEELYASAKHLRSLHPNAFVPSDVLLLGVLTDRKGKQRYQPPYGNLICIGPTPTGTARDTSNSFAAVPSGGHGNQLAVLLASDAGRRPRSTGASFDVQVPGKILHSCGTEIMQVECAWRSEDLYFCVRTEFELAITQYLFPMDRSTTGKHVLRFASEDFRNDRPVDVCLNPFSTSDAANKKSAPFGVVVDSHGGLWQIVSPAKFRQAALRDSLDAASILQQLRQGDDLSDRSGFAKVCYGMTNQQVVVALEDAVRVFDLQDPANDTTIFHCEDWRTKILDMTKAPAELAGTPIRVVLTNHELLWLDVRKDSDPLLRYKHRRDDDPTLSLSILYAGGAQHVVLWSRNGSGTTIFTFSAHPPVQLLCPPYELSGNHNAHGRKAVALLSVARAKRAQEPDIISVLELSKRGSLHQRYLACNGEPGNYEPKVVHVDPGAITTKPMPEQQPTEADAKRSKTVDMRKVYSKIFKPSSNLVDDAAFPTVLETEALDAGDQLMRTPLELSRPMLASDGSSRTRGLSSFSAQSALDTAAVALGNFSNEYEELALFSQPAFRFQLPSALTQGEGYSEPAALAQRLKERYGLSSRRAAEDEHRVQSALRFACEQVALDVAMSSEAVSAVQPKVPNRDAVDIAMSTFETAAQLPPIEYGYLNPRMKSGRAPDSEAARALLSEWTLGGDPTERPPFVNPYNTQVKSDKIADKQFEAFRNRVVEGMDISASQPLPMTSARKASSPTRPRPKSKQMGGKHPTETPAESAQAYAPIQPPVSSQPLQSLEETQTQTQSIPMPFSQVVPGVHGGRPNKKKRVGGF